MKRLAGFVALLLLIGGCSNFPELGGSSAQPASKLQEARITQSFDKDWRFLKSDAQGAETAAFNDAEWRKLDVPHDWSIEGPFDQNAPTRAAGGSLPAGTGWYRKTFTLPADQSQRRFFIEFDGVMANSDVWVNGKHLGKRPYGYSSFQYEMTGHLNFGDGKTNVLAVRADNSPQPASRWYTGAGIYRHVRMISTDPVHVEHWATFVTTPKVAANEATVRVQTSVINQSDAPKQVSVQTTLIDPSGNKVKSAETLAKSIAPGKSVEFDHEIAVASPKLWDLQTRNLYRAIAAVRVDGKTVDDDVNTFGIRSAEFTSDKGFLLNGKKVQMLGVCLHHDGGAVGSAVPLGVWERRFNALKEMGVNAIRTAHNPPAPVFLDLCDRMGFLVMDETFDCWTQGKNTNDYNKYFAEWSLIDTRDLVMRDRNHPSVVMYSAGNEIRDTTRPELAKPILTSLVETFHKYDPTRPVTQGLFRPNADGDGGAYKNGLADILDVVGTNYRDAELLVAWREKPTRKIIGTEQQHGLDTWQHLKNNEQHSGQFIWAGIDYMGEAFWPNVNSQQGLLDRTGAIKPIGLQRKSWWSKTPTVSVVRNDIPVQRPQGDAAGGRRGGRGGVPAAGSGGPVANWTLREPTSQPAQINFSVYTNCEEAELFVNNRSMGTKKRAEDDSPLTWNAPYETGTVKVVGKNGGKIVATDEHRSAGNPVKVLLEVDQTRLSPDFDDVSFVRATVVDANGVRCPHSENLITFKLSGPGFITAVDNADPASHESFQGDQRKAYNGKALAIVKANAASGQIKLEASAEGLAGSSVTIQAAPVK